MADATQRRRAARDRLATGVFDIAIVGGGITGAGVAREAALRGLRVALVEREDFASGTSSRSSRLVHGGVRYLEHGHLRLVFEASRERRILLRIAPHLVRPLAFTWPVYDGARISRLKLSLGLGLYDLLATFRNVASHERLSRRELMDGEPALRADGLEGGARYWDAAADDARLTLVNVIAAVEAGAVALNHAEVTAIVAIGGRAGGVEVADRIDGGQFTIRARHVVNASGPWSDSVRGLETPSHAPTVAGSKGAHIAVPRERVGNRAAITMVHPTDGRVLFTIPAGNNTIFGTTETPTPVGVTEVRASREDVRYLLDAANYYFPAAQLRDNDVVAAWAGIRPLARQLAGADVGSASREHTIDRGPGGVVHVTGGKLTTYREMAEQVVDDIVGPSARRVAPTARIPLPGGDASLAVVEAAAVAVIGDDEVAGRFARAYGTRWTEVWHGCDPALRERVVPELSLTGAECAWAVEHEMAATVGDVLIRRTHVAFDVPDQARSLAPRVAAIIGPRLGWDAAAVMTALEDYDAEIERTLGGE